MSEFRELIAQISHSRNDEKKARGSMNHPKSEFVIDQICTGGLLLVDLFSGLHCLLSLDYRKDFSKRWSHSQGFSLPSPRDSYESAFLRFNTGKCSICRTWMSRPTHSLLSGVSPLQCLCPTVFPFPCFPLPMVFYDPTSLRGIFNTLVKAKTQFVLGACPKHSWVSLHLEALLKTRRM